MVTTDMNQKATFPIEIEALQIVGSNNVVERTRKKALLIETARKHSVQKRFILKGHIAILVGVVVLKLLHWSAGEVLKTGFDLLQGFLLQLAIAFCEKPDFVGANDLVAKIFAAYEVIQSMTI